MSKFTLIINSHAISNFARCEKLHYYNDLCNLESARPRRAFDVGTTFHRFLNIYYHRKVKGLNLPAFNALRILDRFSKLEGVKESDARKYTNILLEYPKTYANDNWKPLATEKGFSKILHEDDDNLFIYEGRIDLIVSSDNKLFPVDHKTQSLQYSIYGFNNQAMGYSWALGTNYFVYNYIKLATSDNFRREIISFSDIQIEQWRQDTIKTAFRMKNSIVNDDFNRSWQCEHKFGKCQYIHICEQPKPEIKNWVINSQFKKGKPYRSW